MPSASSADSWRTVGTSTSAPPTQPKTWKACASCNGKNSHDAEASTLTTELDVTAEPTLLRRKLADIPRMPIVILDGLLGSGVDGPLKPAIAELVQEINELRRTCSNATVWAIDIPTGVHPDTGEIGENAVQADYTAAIGCIKPDSSPTRPPRTSAASSPSPQRSGHPAGIQR